MKIQNFLILILIMTSQCLAETSTEWEPEVNNLLLSQKYEEAQTILTNAGNEGDTKAQAWLGTLYKKFEEYEKAKYWLYKSAEAGNHDGQFYLATYLLEVVQTQAALNEALQWLEKSAAQGNERSKMLVSTLNNQIKNMSNMPKPINGAYNTSEIVKYSSDILIKQFENKPKLQACYKIQTDFSTEQNKSIKTCSEKLNTTYPQNINGTEITKISTELGSCIRDDLMKKSGVSITELIDCMKIATKE